MKCTVVRMRRQGVAVPKYALKDQVAWYGELAVLDVRDEGVNRIIKTARLADLSGVEKRTHVLFDPHLVWMNEGRFTLHGFERAIEEGKIVEYAQSWLCSVQYDDK